METRVMSIADERARCYYARLPSSYRKGDGDHGEFNITIAEALKDLAEISKNHDGARSKLHEFTERRRALTADVLSILANEKNHTQDTPGSEEKLVNHILSLTASSSPYLDEVISNLTAFKEHNVIGARLDAYKYLGCSKTKTMLERIIRVAALKKLAQSLETITPDIFCTCFIGNNFEFNTFTQQLSNNAATILEKFPEIKQHLETYAKVLESLNTLRIFFPMFRSPTEVVKINEAIRKVSQIEDIATDANKGFCQS